MLLLMNWLQVLGARPLVVWRPGRLDSRIVIGNDFLYLRWLVERHSEHQKLCVLER